MKINCATENWRELLWDEIVEAEFFHDINLDVSVYDDLVDEFAGDVLNALSRQAAAWERCYTQSVGAMVAVQSATQDEIAAFNAAVDAARPKAAASLLDFCKVMAEQQSKVCGKQIEIDRSGQGHCWRSISAGFIPYSIIEEIEGEILDGELDTCADFVGSNGEHYRW